MKGKLYILMWIFCVIIKLANLENYNTVLLSFKQRQLISDKICLAHSWNNSLPNKMPAAVERHIESEIYLTLR